MNCMKCGRETQDEKVFCEDCLLEMEKYPVRAGSVVPVFRQYEIPVLKKAPKRHIPTVEEQNKLLRTLLVRALVLLAVCILAIVLMIRPTMHYVLDEHVPIGQNYSSVTSTMMTTAPTSAE